MPPKINEPAVKRAAIARAVRTARRDPGQLAKVTDARRDYAAAKLEDYIRRVVSEAPPLTPEQRDRLATLLRKG